MGGCLDARELEGRKPNLGFRERGRRRGCGEVRENDGADYQKNGEEEDGMKVNFKGEEEDCRGAQVNPEVGQTPLDY